MTDPCLITAAALAASLDDPQVLVVDCRFDLADTRWGQKQFDAGHVPGAAYASLETALSGPVGADTGRHPLPSPESFAATLSAWGLADTMRVVAYDQSHGAGAARLWWLLRASGHPRVQVLDGGFAAWTRGGHPVSQTPLERPPSVVRPRAFSGWVTTQEVCALQASGAVQLVDARAADRFAGQNETIDPVPGHVPGALNRPFLQNLGPDGRFCSPKALLEAWDALLGSADASRVIAMCGSGITACHNLLALQIAGLAGARLYAGSWSEWIRDPARPVATGATR